MPPAAQRDPTWWRALVRPANLVVAGFTVLLIWLVAVIVSWTVASWPEILADLPRENGPRQREFDRRIRERFPAGSRLADLQLYLQVAGFNQVEIQGRWPGYDGAAEIIASRGNFACSDRWTVLWRADEGAQITAISTRHFLGCL